jgi:hypothetical protein
VCRLLAGEDAGRRAGDSAGRAKTLPFLVPIDTVPDWIWFALASVACALVVGAVRVLLD